jgi:tetratricopeptide (TPR) repeat protein
MSEPESSVLLSADDHLRQGWADHGRANETSAEEEFRKAIQLSPALIDAYYGLGLTLKAQRREKEAVQVFEKSLDLVERDVSSEKARLQMLRRLILGHINMLSSGDWNLEKEIWKRSP